MNKLHEINDIEFNTQCEMLKIKSVVISYQFEFSRNEYSFSQVIFINSDNLISMKINKRKVTGRVSLLGLKI